MFGLAEIGGFMSHYCWPSVHHLQLVSKNGFDKMAGGPIPSSVQRQQITTSGIKHDYTKPIRHTISISDKIRHIDHAN